ncbi:hypothetical protein [Neobacillus endophyticus]|uniref:hypothetical protein n=1 Tax=Neobacillus endophyticus TaxID=2738405 RepID=UPI001C27D6A3|nr:hypothetical protein [Neobacillus endophyticus]
MKQIRLRIIDLIDQHGDSFEKCNGCPLCKEIMQLRQKLERDPADKYSHILAKGQDLTKSEISMLLHRGLTANEIRKHLKMSNLEFQEILSHWGLTKKERMRGEDDMAKITLEEYQDLKAQGKSDKEIAHIKKMPPTYLPALKKKWGISKDQPNKAKKETSESDNTPKEKESKSAEYERLIEVLRKDLTSANIQIIERDELIEKLKATVEKYEHVSAACDDIEEEVSCLRAETSSLHHEILKLQNENINLDLENIALRQLVKLWI